MSKTRQKQLQRLTFIYKFEWENWNVSFYICKVSWIKKIAVFGSLIFVLFFSLKEENKAYFDVDQKESTSTFKIDPIHVSFYTQPQSVSSFITNSKAEQPNFFNWLETCVIKTQDFEILKLLTSCIFQDINRCENVSLLLFPFHFFW